MEKNHKKAKEVMEQCGHTFDYCSMCGPMITCGYCGNNCCNGGSGDDCLDECESAYWVQKNIRFPVKYIIKEYIIIVLPIYIKRYFRRIKKKKGENMSEEINSEGLTEELIREVQAELEQAYRHGLEDCMNNIIKYFAEGDRIYKKDLLKELSQVNEIMKVAYQPKPEAEEEQTDE